MSGHPKMGSMRKLHRQKGALLLFDVRAATPVKLACGNWANQHCDKVLESLVVGKTGSRLGKHAHWLV